MTEQISIFDGDKPFRIEKPIRLIELFAGYGSQALALKYLGVQFEHYKISEWAVPSIKAYKYMHFGDDNTDYSAAMTKDDLVNYFFHHHISSDYSTPLSINQLQRMGETKLRNIYNNAKASNNLLSICDINAKDLEIVDTDKFTYLLTYSFPCQDLSSAGKGAGMEKGSGTRSGMLWEVERLLQEGARPQILLMENVPEVIGNKNISAFADWVSSLEKMGYTSKWKIMNATEYKVPQNRRRCFMVSWLGDYYYQFPPVQKLEIRLKNILQKDVEEQYYIQGKALHYVEERVGKYTQILGDNDIAKSAITAKGTQNWTGNFYSHSVNVEREVSKTVRSGGRGSTDRHELDLVLERRERSWQNDTRQETCSRREIRSDRSYVGTFQYGDSDKFRGKKKRFVMGKEIADTIQTTDKEGVVDGCVMIGRLTGGYFDSYDMISRVYSADASCPSLRADQGGGNEIKIAQVVGGIGEKKSNGGTQFYQQDRVYEGDIALAHPADLPGGSYKYLQDLRVRKLTEREVFRLQGVKDEDFEKIAKSISKSLLYHLAGDSIEVSCLMAIFGMMLGVDWKRKIDDLVEDICEVR